MNTLKNELLKLLKKGKNFVKNIPEPHLVDSSLNPTYGSSLLKQIRHILEDVEAFNNGIPKNSINFAIRKRNIEVETSKEKCLIKFNILINELNNLAFAESDMVFVQGYVGSQLNSETVSVATIIRQMYNHIEHHYPPMAMCLFNAGLKKYIPISFGINSLTKKHLEEINKKKVS